MKGFLREVDGLPVIVKALLCIPCVDIFYGVCRILTGAVRNDVLRIALGILTIIPGAFFMWIIDLVWVFFRGHAILLGTKYLN